MRNYWCQICGRTIPPAKKGEDYCKECMDILNSYSPAEDDGEINLYESSLGYNPFG
jgi:hypothetical protein